MRAPPGMETRCGECMLLNNDCLHDGAARTPYMRGVITDDPRKVCAVFCNPHNWERYLRRLNRHYCNLANMPAGDDEELD